MYATDSDNLLVDEHEHVFTLNENEFIMENRYVDMLFDM